MKSLADLYAGFVEHPRFGRQPRLTGLDVAETPDGRVWCHWHSPVGVRVPNTAIAADVTRQRRATIHVTHYFDAKRVCRTCHRPFLFFAEEQQYWYEELQFPLEADCVECVLCRKDAQRLRVDRERYEALLGSQSRTVAGTLELVECGVRLAEASVFAQKVLPRLRGLLNALPPDIDDVTHDARRRLAARIDALSAERAGQPHDREGRDRT